MSEYDNPEALLVVTQSVVTDDVAAVEVQLWLNDNEQFVAKGTSRRDPNDKVDHETGYKLALGRALRNLGRGVLSEGQSLVREADLFKKRQKAATEAARAKKSQLNLPGELPAVTSGYITFDF